MGWIGDYFSWAADHDMNAWLPELVLFIVVPAAALLLALAVALGILKLAGDLGGAFVKGYRGR